MAPFFAQQQVPHFRLNPSITEKNIPRSDERQQRHSGKYFFWCIGRWSQGRRGEKVIGLGWREEKRNNLNKNTMKSQEESKKVGIVGFRSGPGILSKNFELGEFFGISLHTTVSPSIASYHHTGTTWKTSRSATGTVLYLCPSPPVSFLSFLLRNLCERRQRL